MGAQTSYLDQQPIGFVGMIDDARAGYQFITGKNAEASASMPFGACVAFRPSGATSDYDMTLPAASTDKLAGIVRFETHYARVWTDSDAVVHGDLDGVGLRPAALLQIVRTGRVLVTCVDGCTPGAVAYVRYAGGTKGELRSTDAGGSTCVLVPAAQWLTTAAPGGLAWLNVDFA